jgi:hypothetical protein
MQRSIDNGIWKDPDAHLINAFFPKFAENMAERTRCFARFAASVALTFGVCMIVLLSVAMIARWSLDSIGIVSILFAVAAASQAILFRKAIKTWQSNEGRYLLAALFLWLSYLLPMLLLSSLLMFVPNQHPEVAPTVRDLRTMTLMSFPVLIGVVVHFRRLSHMRHQETK